MPPYNFIDLTGQVFYRLTVVKQVKRVKQTNQKAIRWWCQCSCGKIVNIVGHSLRRGLTKSCGCLHKETIRNNRFVHGNSRTPENRAWRGMIQRCTNPNNPAFKNYGGRGITICDEWRHDFMAFYNHVGKKPSSKHSIDRIDNNLGYFPNNVKWATRYEQNNNSRHNHIITVKNQTMTLTQWAIWAKISPKTLKRRIHAGWSAEKAIFKPVKQKCLILKSNT